MKTGKPVIYWDTTCWIAWLWNERQWPTGVLTGLQDIVNEIEANQIILLRSAVLRTEILTDSLQQNVQTQYRQLLRRSNIQEKDADPRVMDKAAEIREYHRKKAQSVSTPDAIHLATAILYNADEFHTMDGLQQGGSKRRKLLSLSGDVGGHNLTVVNPYPRNVTPAQLVTITGPLFPGP